MYCGFNISVPLFLCLRITTMPPNRSCNIRKYGNLCCFHGNSQQGKYTRASYYWLVKALPVETCLLSIDEWYLYVWWVRLHDDVIKWKHFPRYWPFVWGIHRSPVNSPYKCQRRGALMFSLICVWINGWVNNREAGDLRRYHTHYDVSVMMISLCVMRSFIR